MNQRGKSYSHQYESSLEKIRVHLTTRPAARKLTALNHPSVLHATSGETELRAPERVILHQVDTSEIIYARFVRVTLRVEPHHNIPPERDVARQTQRYPLESHFVICMQTDQASVALFSAALRFLSAAAALRDAFLAFSSVLAISSLA